MKDEEVNLEEIEVSHTLGGYRRSEYYSVVRYTIVNRSHRICFHKGTGLVVKKNVWTCVDNTSSETEDHEHGVGAGASFFFFILGDRLLNDSIVVYYNG